MRCHCVGWWVIVVVLALGRSDMTAPAWDIELAASHGGRKLQLLLRRVSADTNIMGTIAQRIIALCAAEQLGHPDCDRVFSILERKALEAQIQVSQLAAASLEPGRNASGGAVPGYGRVLDHFVARLHDKENELRGLKIERNRREASSRESIMGLERERQHLVSPGGVENWACCVAHGARSYVRPIDRVPMQRLLGHGGALLAGYAQRREPVIAINASHTGGGMAGNGGGVSSWVAAMSLKRMRAQCGDLMVRVELPAATTTSTSPAAPPLSQRQVPDRQGFRATERLAGSKLGPGTDRGGIPAAGHPRRQQGQAGWAGLRGSRIVRLADFLDAVVQRGKGRDDARNVSGRSSDAGDAAGSGGDADADALADYYLHDFSIPTRCPQLLNGGWPLPGFAALDMMQQLPPTASPQFTRLFRDYWPSVFVGGAGTSSALHQDWAATSAWMGLVAGRKRFAVVSPAAEHLVRPHASPGNDNAFGLNLLSLTTAGWTAAPVATPSTNPPHEDGAGGSCSGTSAISGTNARAHVGNGTTEAPPERPVPCDCGAAAGREIGRNGFAAVLNEDPTAPAGPGTPTHDEASTPRVAQCIAAGRNDDVPCVAPPSPSSAHPIAPAVFSDVLEAGEVIFLPSRAPHQVRNLGLTVAIAGNMVLNTQVDVGAFLYEADRWEARTAGTESRMYAMAADAMRSEQQRWHQDIVGTRYPPLGGWGVGGSMTWHDLKKHAALRHAELPP